MTKEQRRKIMNYIVGRNVSDWLEDRFLTEDDTNWYLSEDKLAIDKQTGECSTINKRLIDPLLFDRLVETIDCVKIEDDIEPDVSERKDKMCSVHKRHLKVEKLHEIDSNKVVKNDYDLFSFTDENLHLCDYRVKRGQIIRKKTGEPIAENLDLCDKHIDGELSRAWESMPNTSDDTSALYSNRDRLMKLLTTDVERKKDWYLQTGSPHTSLEVSCRTGEVTSSLPFNECDKLVRSYVKCHSKLTEHKALEEADRRRANYLVGIGLEDDRGAHYLEEQKPDDQSPKYTNRYRMAMLIAAGLPHVNGDDIWPIGHEDREIARVSIHTGKVWPSKGVTRAEIDEVIDELQSVKPIDDCINEADDRRSDYYCTFDSFLPNKTKGQKELHKNLREHDDRDIKMFR